MKTTKQNIAFKIICKKCETEAFLYEKFEGEYEVYHLIKCRNCGNKSEDINGRDG